MWVREGEKGKRPDRVVQEQCSRLLGRLGIKHTGRLGPGLLGGADAASLEPESTLRRMRQADIAYLPILWRVPAS